ncbi:hypothetical protein FUAX_11740 [Fulvitalea axinellae]|uniref:Outer membrane protein beta-barrel domain-containing protein n=1 Tax=Fulvitalea axinellae TaxID=1182444 RepID=A0AAU9CLC4_9BACT|nr:hypothetical protein FUAX_11740 [Fulvitalea axinellae]
MRRLLFIAIFIATQTALFAGTGHTIKGEPKQEQNPIANETTSVGSEFTAGTKTSLGYKKQDSELFQDLDQNYDNQLGFILNGLDPKGVIFKLGHRRSKFRFQASNFSFRKTTNEDSDPETEEYDYRIDLGVGIELRRQLSSRVQFFYGADLIYSYNKIGWEKTTPDTETFESVKNNSIGIAGVLGAEYLIGQRFSISAEYSPRIAFSNMKREDSEDTRYGESSTVKTTLADDSILNFLISYRF